MFHSRPVPFPHLVARLRSDAGRRALGLGLALVIEILIIVVLLTMVRVTRSGVEKEPSTMVVMNAREVSEDQPEARQPAPREPAQQQPQQPQPQQPQSAQPAPPTPALVAPQTPAAPGFIPMQQFQLSPSAPAAPPARPSRPAYNSAMYGDSERVGTAPNGEPLYAAEWYRHPDDHMLGTYLSTAHGPGWGLIACRTAPEYRVEDCVPLEEYPQGSEINRSILAAAWEFRVRPPRRGGMPLVGSWVRIRIDYDLYRR